ncbi:hypothetical protein PV08_07313 [Exophiala spinifera]|uniref:Uncharacterized protein n=1 Tax=Exophiala spinifera TaxID=91928 RepID=A0A0D2BTI3_9EURO|nr:uncharacterized protein PV08_07313 [Exophiala spinifera]KIW14529.1 hypothetical protein PV08_07313 [Exophiala spinifera]
MPRYAAIPGDVGAHSQQTLSLDGRSMGKSWNLPALRFRGRNADQRPNRENSQQKSYGPSMWNSLWLSTTVLSAVTGLYALLIVVLLFIWNYINRNAGIPLITSDHYSWTYGPTALLVIVVAVWRQVDYHCKAIAPWATLSQEPLKGSSNILLDYVSPIQVFSLYKSVSGKHHTVTAGILGFILLKLIVVLSTGLFVAAPKLILQADVDLVQYTTFNGSLFNSSAISPTLNDSSLVYTAFGILSRGLAYTDGTYQGLVYERFGPPANSLRGIETITATVDALIPSFECQSAPFSIKLQPANSTDPHPADSIQLQFEECQLLGDGTPVYVLNPRLFSCPSRQLSPLVQRMDCFNESDSRTADNWQLLTLADLRYNQTLQNSSSPVTLGDSITATSWSTSVNAVVGIACRSVYAMERVNVTYDYSQTPANITVTRLEPGVNRTMAGFSNFDLGKLFTASLSAAASMFGNLNFDSYAEEYPNTMFKVMAAAVGGGYETLLDENNMTKAAEIVFQAVAVQILSKYLTQEVDSPLQGQAAHQEERLQLNDLSLWLMVSGLVIMMSLAGFVLWKRPKDIVARDPDQLLFTALLLQPSRRARKILSRCCTLSETSMLAQLDNHKFAISTDVEEQKSFLLASDPLTDITTPDQNSQPKWWKPLGARWFFVLTTLLLPLAVIGTLEALQVSSDSHNGIATVSAQDSLSSKTLTRYLPALVMLLSATLFNSVDFNIAVLAPYNALKSGARTPQASIMSNVIGLVAPYAIWQSLRRRYWGAALSGTAAIFGSVLTIISSGLYTVDFVPTTSPMQVQRTDSFQTTWQNSALNDSGAAVLTSLTESSNLTFPQFTFDELALPGLQAAGDPPTFSKQGQATLSLRTSALRASLNCTTLSTAQFNVSTFYNPTSGPSASVSATFTLPEECPYGGFGGNMTIMEINKDWQLPFVQNSSYVASMLDVHVGPFDPVLASSSGELAPAAQQDNPPGCPSLAFIYGYVDVNDDSRNTITTRVCYQQMQQVPVHLWLSVPDLDISPGHPPTLDESDPVLLKSGQNGETGFPYRLEVHMDNELSLYNQTQFAPSSISQSTIDAFFQGVLFGRAPIPEAWLADSARSDEVVSAIQAFYRRYMAQAISSNMRVPTAAADAPLLTGNVTTPMGTLRVHQNKPSKLALQIILGVMTLCGALAIWLAPPRDVVPHNPCSIAGSMVVWAGSRFCESPKLETFPDQDRPVLPDGAVHMSNKKLMGSGALDSWMFKLGWWDRNDGTRRYGIDAVMKESRWTDDY